MLAAEAVHEFVRPLLAPLATVAPLAVQKALGSMAADGHAALAGEGYDKTAIQLRFAADMRYLGQSSQLMVHMPDDCYDASALHADFEQLYSETFGYIARGRGCGARQHKALGHWQSRQPAGIQAPFLDSHALAGESGERMVSFGRGTPRIAARLVPRMEIEGGPIVGPAIIESYDTTIVVPPGCTARAAGAWLHRNRNGGDRCLRPRPCWATRSLLL